MIQQLASTVPHSSDVSNGQFKLNSDLQNYNSLSSTSFCAPTNINSNQNTNLTNKNTIEINLEKQIVKNDIHSFLPLKNQNFDANTQTAQIQIDSNSLNTSLSQNNYSNNFSMQKTPMNSNFNLFNKNSSEISSNQAKKKNNIIINNFLSTSSQNFNSNSQILQTPSNISISAFNPINQQQQEANLQNQSSNFQNFQPKTNNLSSLKYSPKQKKIRKLFSVEEDQLLTRIMYGKPFTTWIDVAAQIPGRTARQCRDRWANYLSPKIKNGPWSQNEDEILAQKHKEYGPQWTVISKFFDGRSENNVKNRWYTHVKNKCYEKSYNSMQFNNFRPNVGGFANLKNYYNNNFNLIGNSGNNGGNLIFYGNIANSDQQIGSIGTNNEINSYNNNNPEKFIQPQKSSSFVNTQNILPFSVIPSINITSNTPNLAYLNENINRNSNSSDTSNNVSANLTSSPSKSLIMNQKRELLPPISSLVS